MTRLLAILIMLLGFATPLAAKETTLPPEVERFLRSREVLGTIAFAEGSAALDPAGRQAIDRAMPRLEALGSSHNLVRVEGFASAAGGGETNVPISMARARAVIDYIRDHHPLAIDLFLTGFGGSESASVNESPGCRAEIAVYDNIWQMKDAVVEKVVQR